MKQRELVVLAVLCGLLTAAVFWSVKSIQTATLGPAPAQPDSMVYFQYARAITEGHAYRYTHGQDFSTGSTSHLYPFTLAALIHLGGVARLEAMSFVLNCASHVLSLLLVALIAWRLKPRAAPVAVLLAALSGHLTITVHSDCDMSLFVPLALGIFYAAICGRPSWLGITLGIAAWTRPEGMVMSALLVMATFIGWFACRESRKAIGRFALAGLVGVASGVLVLLWNHHLTGAFGFHSTAHKSWFEQFPWTGALIRSSQDFMAIWSGAFWGTGSGVRAMLGIPLLGAALFLVGFATKPRESSLQTLAQNWWVVAIVAATGLVAISGWAGAVFDRYLGWITPFICIYAALGLVTISDALKNRALLVGGALALALLQSVGWTYFLGVYGASCAETAAMAGFARSAVAPTHDHVDHEGEHDETCDHGERIITVGEAGFAFYLGDRDVVNLNSIVSPGFAFNRSPVENLERLKYWPWRRAPLLLLSDAQAREPWLAPLVGQQIAHQDAGSLRDSPFGIYRADYSIFDRAGTKPLRPDIRAHIGSLTNSCTLDVGFAAWENKLKRRVFTRTTAFIAEPFVATRTIGTNLVMEVGDVVFGSETFTIPTSPGRLLRCVLRTASTATTSLACADGTTRTRTFEIASPLHLQIHCGGQTFKLERKIDPDANSFDEITFDLPASVITDQHTEITIAGDHVALAWWFFQ